MTSEGIEILRDGGGGGGDVLDRSSLSNAEDGRADNGRAPSAAEVEEDDDDSPPPPPPLHLAESCLITKRNHIIGGLAAVAVGCLIGVGITVSRDMNNDSQTNSNTSEATTDEAGELEWQTYQETVIQSTDTTNNDGDNLNNNDTNPPSSTSPSKRPTIKPSTQRRPTKYPTSKPTTLQPTQDLGIFRLRLYWQHGYKWQESSHETFWCMETSNAELHDSVRIDVCNTYKSEQRWVKIGMTFRPNDDMNLCMTTTGTTESYPIRLYECEDGNIEQQFTSSSSYIQKNVKFQMISKRYPNKCISQLHHPKRNELVYPQDCEVSFGDTTSYWITY